VLHPSQPFSPKRLISHCSRSATASTSSCLFHPHPVSQQRPLRPSRASLCRDPFCAFKSFALCTTHRDLPTSATPARFQRPVTPPPSLQSVTAAPPSIAPKVSILSCALKTCKQVWRRSSAFRSKVVHSNTSLRQRAVCQHRPGVASAVEQACSAA
jgi:hypothetical protein